MWAGLCQNSFFKQINSIFCFNTSSSTVKQKFSGEKRQQPYQCPRGVMSKCPSHLNLSHQAAGMHELPSYFSLTLISLPSLELLHPGVSPSLPWAHPCHEPSFSQGLHPPVQQELQHPRLITLTPCSFPGMSQSRPCSSVVRQGWLVHQANLIILTLAKRRR